MEKKFFGKLPSGEDVTEYTLKSGNLEVSFLDFGGIVRRLVVHGTDVVCGFDTLEDYLADDSYQGAIIGRVGNRIRNGVFTLNGETYTLAKNENGITHLHGGTVGFNRHIFRVASLFDDTIVFSYHSRDGEEGYPGNLSLSVTYHLANDTLSIRYLAMTDKDTPVSLTNHSYFNLNGFNSGTVLGHTLTVNADSYAEVDENLVPTGNILPVTDTVYDVRTPVLLKERIDKKFGGYDTDFVLNGDKAETVHGRNLPFAAELTGKTLGVKVYTDQPDIQVYTANMLTGKPAFKGGYRKGVHNACCLETQITPDAVNCGRGILKVGEVYDKMTAFVFSKL